MKADLTLDESAYRFRVASHPVSIDPLSDWDSDSDTKTELHLGRSKWRSDVNQVVTRVPTSQELKERTESYEGIAATEAKTKRESLLFSAIRAGSADLTASKLTALRSGRADYGDVRSLLHAARRCQLQHGTSLRCGSDPSHESLEMKNAIARSDSHDIIRALVEAGISNYRPRLIGTDPMMIFMLVVTGHSSTSTNRYGWTAVDFARQCNNLTVGSQSSLLSCLVVLCPLSLNISRVVLQGADIMESKNVSCSTLCRHGVALLMDFPLSPFLILTSSLFQTDADKFAVDVGKESTSATEAEDKNSRFVLTGRIHSQFHKQTSIRCTHTVNLLSKTDEANRPAVRSKQQDLIHFVLSKIDKAGRCSVGWSRHGILGFTIARLGSVASSLKLVVDPVNQNTALHYAVLLDDDEEICKLLLLSGADTQARNSAGTWKYLEGKGERASFRHEQSLQRKETEPVAIMRFVVRNQLAVSGSGLRALFH
eukprot:2517593-Rhodomonas_salina.3